MKISDLFYIYSNQMNFPIGIITDSGIYFLQTSLYTFDICNNNNSHLFHYYIA